MLGPQPRNDFVRALVDGLRDLGYVYGEQFVTEARGAEGRADRYPALIAELLQLKVDLIVGVGAAVRDLKAATSTVPIVTPGVDDPVGFGFVQSLARPGGNITGLSFQSVDLIGKQLELLREVASQGAPLAVLWDHLSTLSWDAAQAAAHVRGWKLLSLKVQDPEELDGAFARAIRAQAGALLVVGGVLLDPQFRRVAELANKNRLSSMYRFRFQVAAGGLMSYGPNLVDMWRRAAAYVGKILKGAKPGDLPVEQPTKFELVINLKTAKALGLTIPPSLLLRADEVIQ
jgi:putative ABC transport system substrate-binding protein